MNAYNLTVNIRSILPDRELDDTMVGSGRLSNTPIVPTGVHQETGVTCTGVPARPIGITLRTRLQRLLPH